MDATYLPVYKAEHTKLNEEEEDIVQSETPKCT